MIQYYKTQCERWWWRQNGPLLAIPWWLYYRKLICGTTQLSGAQNQNNITAEIDVEEELNERVNSGDLDLHASALR